MKYSIACGAATGPSTPLLFAGDFSSSMRKAAGYGYDAIEIHTPEIETLDVGKVKKTMKETGLFVSTLGTGTIYGKYGLYLMDQDRERRNDLVKRVEKFIDTAAELSSRVTIGSIKGNVPKDGERELYLETMGETLSVISDYAEKRGVTVLLEATNRYENNVINTASDIVSMIGKYNLKSVLALMDSFHINIEEKEMSRCLFEAGKYLGHIHFGDNLRSYPGSGSFLWDVFCGEIKASGYDGVLSVECLPLPDGDTAAEKTIEFFHRYFG